MKDTLHRHRSGMHFGGTTRHFEGGEEYLPMNSCTGEPWGAFPVADADIVDQVVKAANAALADQSWANLTPTRPGYYLHNFADMLEAHQEELAVLEAVRCEFDDTPADPFVLRV